MQANVVNDDLLVTRDNHCTSTHQNGSLWERTLEAHLRPSHLPLPSHLWLLAGRNVRSLWLLVRCHDRMIRDDGDAQKKVNLSPGAASETSAFSSRSYVISQYRLRSGDGLVSRTMLTRVGWECSGSWGRSLSTVMSSGR